LFPKLIDFNYFTIHSYGFLLALGFLVGLLVAARAATKENIDKTVVYDLGIYLTIAALVGSKLLFLITDLNYYIDHPTEIFSLTTLRSGGVYYGGLALATLTGIWITSKKNLPVWKVTDFCAPGIALGQAIGRLGCFAAGCCYGNPTSQPWGVTFQNKYSQEFVGVPLGISLHPTQLYQAVANFLIFGLLWIGLKKKRFDGQIFILYLFCYSVVRFLIEFLRGDTARGFVFDGIFSTSQLISLLLLPIIVVLYLMLRQKNRIKSV